MGTTYSVMFCGDVYRIRGDFAQAGKPVERETDDGWEATGFRTADFRHDPEAAMRHELTQSVIASGDDPEDLADEIADALSQIF